MRKILISLSLSCYCLQAISQYHQEIDFGVQAGASYTFMEWGGSSPFEIKSSLSPGLGVYAQVPFNQVSGLRAGCNYGQFIYQEVLSNGESTNIKYATQVIGWYTEAFINMGKPSVYIGFRVDQTIGVKRISWLDGVKKGERYAGSVNADFLVKVGAMYPLKWGISLFADLSVSMAPVSPYTGFDTYLGSQGIRAGIQYSLFKLPYRKFFRSSYER